jgi:hypothetical protein
MGRRLAALFVALLLVGWPTGTPRSARAASGTPLHYGVVLTLEPAARTLSVRATVTNLQPDAVVEFDLAETLTITSSAPAVVPVTASRHDGPVSGGATPLGARDLRSVRYRTTSPVREGRLDLSYQGRMDFELSPQREEYTRGFRETAGTIATEGVYLSAASRWYPQIAPDLLTFDLEVHAPAEWHVISEGNGTSRRDRGPAHWTSAVPVEEIHVVGGPLRVWRDRAGTIETLVYLHEDDPALAGKYLEATAQYLEMYRRLIGPYPYSKFALVENFWESGYGMPSFTLLGPSVLRFPFILTSSYPHEILHNWWGNSVFVAEAGGNWSEGLTAYLADHLLKEQLGQGAEYRRATLQKYASYVAQARDFPLVEFRARDDAVTEAVGYGKTAMGFHMLRLRLGDDRFRAWLAQLYREYAGRRAAFGDLQRVAEEVGGERLGPFFDDLVTRAGAPVLALQATVAREGDVHVVRGSVRQEQPEPPFAFDVPVVLQTTDGAEQTVARFAGREASFELRSADTPVALRADPRFDVFRRLDPREIPPSIGQIFGEPRVVAILPSAAPAAEQQAWRALAGSWTSASHEVLVVSDREVEQLPDDRAVWLLGRENALAPTLFSAGIPVELTDDVLAIAGEHVPLAGHAAVITRRHPAATDRAIGWILNAVPQAFEGLGRKLPHYGRYSYLVFEGTEPVNVVRGEWTSDESPLTMDLRPPEARRTVLPPLPDPRRPALIDLPSTFSAQALADHVQWLAAPDRGGRAVGSAGLQQAGEYIAARFEAAGLAPGGVDGTFFQPVSVTRRDNGPALPSANVVGVLRGTRQEWRNEAVLVTAHYDHLGHRPPAEGEGSPGRILPGADDNASGIAVLLELARVLAAAGRPARSIVFVAFTAEEVGLQGAREFARRNQPIPTSGLIGVVNLDTVGRLGTGSVSILGAGTAAEWPHIFRGASFVTGVESASVPGNDEASDQLAFIERGVPSVQVFTGPHADYHQPGDTADKVDVPGLVKVASLVREAIAYLAERPQRLTATIAATPGTGSGTTAADEGDRRVIFGAVPDFAFVGRGVRLADVTTGSPAARDGLRPGDIITSIDGAAIDSLQTFARLLRTLSPGQRLQVVYLRDGREARATVTVAVR